MERKQENRKGAAGCAIVALFFAGALFYVAAYNSRAAKRIQNLPDLDLAALQLLPPGEDGLVTGVLQGNIPLVEDLVLYECEIWGSDEYTDSDGVRIRGYRWTTVDRLIPPLVLFRPDGKVRTAAVSSARVFGECP